MPQSRHRKTNKAKKRPKGMYPATKSKPLSSRNRQVRVVAIILVVALAAAAVVYLIAKRGGPTSGTEITTASGLKYIDHQIGTGATAQNGKTLSVNYTGTLEDGTKFDSSYDQGRPYQFRLGTGSVIKGWDEGLKDMKVGGKRRLIVPAALGYGLRGSPPKIPGNSTLIFEVELMDVR